MNFRNKALEYENDEYSYGHNISYEDKDYDNIIHISKNKPIDPYKIKNVNFTLIDEDDERWDEYKQQRLERGFDDSELWSLDMTIAKFILPRLKAFSIDPPSYPGFITYEEWKEILQKMIKGFENILDDELTKDMRERNKIIEDGLTAFKDYFFNLWS